MIWKESGGMVSCLLYTSCADFILRDHENVLKILIQAPIEKRIDRIADKYLIELRDEAKKEVLRNDKLRSTYYPVSYTHLDVYKRQVYCNG